MVTVQIKGFKSTKKFLDALPVKLDIALNNSNKVFVRKLKTAMVKRAPIDTGRLKDSIEIEPTKKRGKTRQYKITVSAPYAAAQEFGFKPHAFITDPGRIGFATNKLPLGQYVFVKKNTPFIQPAINATINKLDSLNNAALNKVLGTK